MSQENMEVIRRVYERGSSGGLEATLDVIDDTADPDFEVRATGHLPDLPEGGRIRGHEAAKAYFAALFESFDEWSAEPEEFIDAGHVVVVVVQQIGRGKGSGVEIRDRVVHVWGVRVGKVTYMDVYRTKSEALEAVGLPEQDAHADS